MAEHRAKTAAGFLQAEPAVSCPSSPGGLGEISPSTAAGDKRQEAGVIRGVRVARELLTFRGGAGQDGFREEVPQELKYPEREWLSGIG